MPTNLVLGHFGCDSCLRLLVLRMCFAFNSLLLLRDKLFRYTKHIACSYSPPPAQKIPYNQFNYSLRRGVNQQETYRILKNEGQKKRPLRRMGVSIIVDTNYKAFSTISSTTNGSNNVDVSPKFETSPSAILRKIRRIILPERVFGKPDTN